MVYASPHAPLRLRIPRSPPLLRRPSRLLRRRSRGGRLAQERSPPDPGRHLHARRMHPAARAGWGAARLDPDFDWREEAWETLTHELRHHVEWRARAPGLEAYDRAVEANFARQEGERFDPALYLDGDSPA